MGSNDLFRDRSCSYVKITSRAMKSLLRYGVDLRILRDEKFLIAL